jgi:uncharacterized protein
MSEQKLLPGTVTWRDLTVKDAPGLRDFYSGVVGWKWEECCGDFNMLVPSSGECVAGICHARGINADIPPQWLIYITVPDVDAAADRCARLGGAVLVPPRSAGSGRICVIRDPAGAVCALYARANPD